MAREHELVVPALEALNRSLKGELTTTELRHEIKQKIHMTPKDREPLTNRSDQKIDQIIRNLKSHRAVPGNPVYEGLMEDVPKGLRITAAGRAALKRKGEH